VVYGDADNFIAKRHILVEQAIVESGIPYTFLRPGSFASNALFWRKQIKNENIVRYPYPLSQSAPIHEADIAEVATNVLTSSGFEGMTPLLTGPESITQLRQVELIGEVTEREIIFEEMNPEQAVAEMSSYLPSQVAEILVKVLKRNNGKPALISDEVEKITGRTARSFSEWVWEHRNEFIS
jgi:uncharacterized protein YbjT (DUF2867 family)